MAENRTSLFEFPEKDDGFIVMFRRHGGDLARGPPRKIGTAAKLLAGAGGYIIMSNHIHLVVSVDDGFTVSDFIRDCKKFTSTRILDAIENSGVESRREWMLH